MSYFLVHRSEWRLVQALDQLEALRTYDRGVRMHSETECVRTGQLENVVRAKTWDDAWKEAEGLLRR